MKLFKKIFFIFLILNTVPLTSVKAVPESFADLAEKLMPSVVNISTTQTVKTTVGIAATNITDASGTENSADTTLGEITQSLGHVAGGLGSLRGYQHVAEASSATLIQAASHLQDTNIAAETAKATKNQIIKNYALAMVAHANNEEMEKLKVLA